MLQRRVDGIVFFTYNNSKAHMDYFGKLIGNTPFVLMDESREDLDVNLVATNGYGGIKEAVRYFIDCGHSRIGCLYGKTEAGSNRYYGYIDALKESGFEVRAEYVRQCDFSIESGYEAGKKLLALEKRPSAVICVADSIAVGFLKCMIESGIRVPEEMEVMGFDNIGMSMVISPQLSTISQNFEMLSKQAIHILMEVIDEPNKMRAWKKELIKGEIIFRQSTKQPGTVILSDEECTDMLEKKRK
jgi:LacI family transcriptional regulator